ncbi:hypothetical protein [Bacillus sp. JJ722]|uniref:hypothetical protein n=1 Tax=Bacillus sp. JJ722 TaxID=3122973 RepID=UPI0030005D30
MNNEITFNQILSLRKIKDVDLLKVNLYGYCSQVILSKELFNNNKELVEFIGFLNFKYREYVFASRTIVISRVIRDIEKKDVEELNILRENIITFVSHKLEIDVTAEKENTKSKNKEDSNYAKTIIEKYRRGK